MTARQDGKEPARIAYSFGAARVALIIMFGLTSGLAASQSHLNAAEQARLSTGVSDRSVPSVKRGAERWRYKFHNGRWWYWTAENTWIMIDGREWVANSPERPLPSNPTIAQRSESGDFLNSAHSGTMSGRRTSTPAAQDELQILKRKLQNLESRVRQQEALPPVERKHPAVVPWIRADEIRLLQLWRSRREAARFYDSTSDDYFFNGRGHFLD